MTSKGSRWPSSLRPCGSPFRRPRRAPMAVDCCPANGCRGSGRVRAPPSTAPPERITREPRTLEGDLRQLYLNVESRRHPVAARPHAVDDGIAVDGEER